MKKIQFSQEQINVIIDLYNNNYTQKQIGEHFNVDRSVIKRVLLENNIKLRNTTHKHKCNYSIFKEIDNPEKAYWLGFLAADGCNYNRENNATICISLHQKDEAHLKKFQKFLSADNELQYYISNTGFGNNTPMCRIAIYSKEMSQDLNNKGIISHKSLILKPPKIEERYYLPFICGYFDGDGSISKATNCYNNFNISFLGTKEMLEWINNIVNMEASLEQRVNNPEKNNYYIRCGGTNKPYRILNLLYSSCETHLDRKYKLYKNLETVVLNRNIQ